MFLEPVLSSADVVQHIPDFVVVKRLPDVVHEDSTRYVNMYLVNSPPYFYCHFRCQNLLVDLQDIDFLPEKIAITAPLVFGKIAHLVHVRVADLASARYKCVPRYSLPKYRQGFASQPLHIDELQQEIFLGERAEHVEPFRADRSKLLVLVVCGLIWYRLETVTILRGVCSTKNLHLREAET